MPQVPYQPFPTEQPTSRGAGPIGISTPGEAFGTGIGQAIKGLGGQLEHAGNELFARAQAFQALQNDTDARNAAVDVETNIGMEEANFRLLKGQDAYKAYPDYVEKIKQIRKDALDSASNPMMRKMLDDQIARRVSYSIVNGGAHAGQEAKTANVKAIESQIDSDTAFVHANPRDDNIYHETVGKVVGMSHRAGEMEGADPATIDNVARHRVSALAKGRIVEASRTDSEYGRKLLEELHGDLSDKDYSFAEDRVIRAENLNGSKVIADRVTKKLTPEMSQGKLEEVVKEAESIAEKQSPNNAQLQDYTRARVIGNFHQLQTQWADSNKADLDTVGKFVHEGADGKPITSIDQLKQNPQVWDTYQRLNDKQQDGFMKRIELNNKLDSNEWTQEKEAHFNELKGKLSTGKLSNYDVDSDPNLIKPQRAELKRLIKATEGNVYINRVLHEPDIKNMTEAAGLTSPTGKPNQGMETDYNKFAGTLRGVLEDYEKREGKKPHAEDEAAIAARVIRGMLPKSRGWFGGANYEKELPDSVREGAIRDLKKKGIESPDETDIRGYITRLQLGR
jgi:hypothetical protein